MGKLNGFHSNIPPNRVYMRGSPLMRGVCYEHLQFATNIFFEHFISTILLISLDTLSSMVNLTLLISHLSGRVCLQSCCFVHILYQRRTTAYTLHLPTRCFMLFTRMAKVCLQCRRHDATLFSS